MSNDPKDERPTLGQIIDARRLAREVRADVERWGGADSSAARKLAEVEHLLQTRRPGLDLALDTAPEES